jgi:hypothetical protein
MSDTTIHNTFNHSNIIVSGNKKQTKGDKIGRNGSPLLTTEITYTPLVTNSFKNTNVKVYLTQTIN